MSPMTATTTDVDIRILLLTGKNCTMWAFWIKARLVKKGIWHVVNAGPTTEEKQDECDASDFLVSTISESILSTVFDASTANDVWEKLRELYASTDASIVGAIEDEICRFKYSSGSMEYHFNRIQSTYSKAQECFRRCKCSKCCTSCTAHFLWYARATWTYENNSIDKWSCKADSRKHWVSISCRRTRSCGQRCYWSHCNRWTHALLPLGTNESFVG